MRSAAALLVLGALPAVAAAQPLVPAPRDPGHDAALLAKAEGWVRLQQGVLSVPLGFGLEAFVSDPVDRAALEAFVASGERDVMTATGSHPYALVDRYGEMGDLGMFGGVQAAGDAFRYAVLRDGDAPSGDVDAAREALHRAMDGLHWQTAITGVPGVVARGIARIEPEPGAPPVPGTPPTTLPLFDASGDPQPADKEPTWRDDQSDELPFLVWLDDCSKDQLDGYVFALGAIYDAVAGDPTVDAARVSRLVEDARAIGLALMEEQVVNGRGDAFDLVIMDADGRPTSFHDLNATLTGPGTAFSRPINGFNAIMALGIVKTLHHITGDDAIGRFYYEELIGRRAYLRVAADTLDVIYLGTTTNYSNVNMAFVAAWGVLRYEADPTIRDAALALLESSLYAPGKDREARGLGLPFFDFIYAGFRGANDAAGSTAVAEGLATLGAFPAAPMWNPAVTNCDDAEIASRDCVADDGTPLPLADTLGRGDVPVAVDPVPMRLRPPSNFEHRSDPHRVNGGGGDRLDPAGSMHAAYWMGRLLAASDDGASNVSPHARAPLPWAPPGGRDGGAPAPDGGVAPGAGDGCGCRVGDRSSPGPGWLAAALALVGLRRRRIGPGFPRRRIFTGRRR